VKVCSVPGCPSIQPESRCAEHRSERERARGTRGQRGYGVSHRALRASYQQRMDAGERFTCWRCRKPIDPKAWDLGHKDDRTGYAGPECKPCNRATAGRR
jgi:hypothetical protein